MKNFKKVVSFICILSCLVFIATVPVSAAPSAAVDKEREANNTKETANGINLSMEYCGDISRSSDKDFYKFALQQDGFIDCEFSATVVEVNKKGWKLKVLSANKTVCEVLSYGETVTTGRVSLPAGDYYISVEKYKTFSNAQYKFNVRQIAAAPNDEKEPDNSNSTAYPLSIGLECIGNLQSENDVDIYRFEMLKDGKVIVEFSHDANNSVISTWRVKMSHYADFTVAINNPSYKTGEISLKKDVYFIIVRKSSKHSSALYKLKVIDPSAPATPPVTAGSIQEIEPNDYKAYSQMISLDTECSGNLRSEQDKDFYKFTLPQDGFIDCEFSSSAVIDESKGWKIQMLSSNSTVSEMVTVGQPVTTGRLSLQAGTYFVSVERNMDFSAAAYKLLIKQIPGGPYDEREPNAAVGAESPISVGIEYTGNLQSTMDYDCYVFNLTEDRRIKIEFSHEAVDLPGNPWRIILISGYGSGSGSSTGYLNFDSALKNPTSTSAEVALPKGPYIIQIYNKNPYSNMLYKLKVIDLDTTSATLPAATPAPTTSPAATAEYIEAEPNGRISSSQLIETGNTYTENLSNANDTDFYHVILSQSGKISVEIGHELQIIPERYWIAKLTDSKRSYTTLAASGREEISKTKDFNVPAGDYYVLITKGNKYSSNNYTVKVNFTAADLDFSESEDNNSINTANIIPGNQYFTGNLSSQSDVDFYSITINAFKPLNIRFYHAGNNSSNYIWNVALVNQFGSVLIEKNVRGTEHLASFIKPGMSEGAYYLRVVPSRTTVSGLSPAFDNGNYEVMYESN